MTREDICTCGQYSQCPTCGKSRSNYAELMKENERMREALEELMDWQNGPPLSSAKWVEGWGNAMAEAERLLAYHGRQEVTP